jgi:predicted ATPase
LILELKVNGFKSLNNFSLRFNKGLNVLIGPNGAGKTNICQALGLLASAAEGPMSDYILSLGGAPAVFATNCTVDISSSTHRFVSAACKGETKTDDGKVILRYNYSFEIDFGEELQITKEDFRLYKKGEKNRFQIILDAKRKNISNVIIRVRNKKEIGPIETKFFNEKRQLSFNLRHDPLTSFLPIIGMVFSYCYMARHDMMFSMAWNIDPHLAKKSSDILEPQRMLPDGRRLPNAIYALIRSKDDKISEIDTFLSRILPGYSKIESNTSGDGLRTFHMIDSRGFSCPATSLSDGTIKALALLVGVLSQQHSTSIIEEPENYLHPWACQALIDLFRDYFINGVCILTTHSETILNSITPNEVIIVENLEGLTRSHRLSHERQLREAIRISGFGCGYHYLAGSLGGIPE